MLVHPDAGDGLNLMSQIIAAERAVILVFVVFAALGFALGFDFAQRSAQMICAFKAALAPEARDRRSVFGGGNVEIVEARAFDLLRHRQRHLRRRHGRGDGELDDDVKHRAISRHYAAGTCGAGRRGGFP
jgi:hypothetical protein